MNCHHQYKVVLIPTLLYFVWFCAFSGKMVIQKTKKFSNHSQKTA